MSEEKLPPPSRRKDRKCDKCPTLIRRDNKSGLCPKCVKDSPDFRRRSREARLKHYEDPANRQKTGDAVRRANMVDPTIRVRKSEAMKAIAATPEWKARNAEQCRERKLWELGVAGITPEVRSRQAKTLAHKRHWAWCPPELLEEAKHLRRSKNLPLRDVKRIIMDQHEKEMKEFRRKLGY